MDRTEFLKVYGIAILTAIGVSGLLKALAGAQPKQHTKTAPQFGVYGGETAVSSRSLLAVRIGRPMLGTLMASFVFAVAMIAVSPAALAQSTHGDSAYGTETCNVDAGPDVQPPSPPESLALPWGDPSSTSRERPRRRVRGDISSDDCTRC